MALDKNAIAKEAQKFVAKGQLDKAILEWRKLLKDYPSDSAIFNTIGDLCLKKGDAKGKAEAVDAYYRAGTILAAEGFTSKAIAVYKKVLNIDPKKIEVHLALGDMNADKGLTGSALESYKLVADHYTAHKETAKALGIYQKMADLNPANSAFRLKLADMYAKEGMKEQAITAYLQAADVHVAKETFNEARQIFEKALVLDPTNREVYHKAGIVYFKEGKFVEACKTLKSVFEGDPSNKEVTDLYLEALAKAGRSADAEEVYRKLLAQDAGRADLRQKLYDLFLANQDYDKAFAEASSLAGAKVEARENEAAEALMKGFLAAAPTHAGGRRWMGDFYKTQGRQKDAATELVAAADILISDGNNEGAKEALAEALALVPDMAEAKQRLDTLTPQAAPAPEALQPPPAVTMEPPRAAPRAAAPPLPEEDSALAEAFTEVDVLIKYGLSSKAIEQLESLAVKFPASVQVRTRLRDLYGDQGNMSKAAAHMAALADIYSRNGRTDEARSALQSALELDPKNAAIKAKLAGAPAPAEAAPAAEATPFPFAEPLEGPALEEVMPAPEEQSLEMMPGLEMTPPDLGEELVIPEPTAGEEPILQEPAPEPPTSEEIPFEAPFTVPETPLEEAPLPQEQPVEEQPAPEELAAQSFATLPEEEIPAPEMPEAEAAAAPEEQAIEELPVPEEPAAQPPFGALPEEEIPALAPEAPAAPEPTVERVAAAPVAEEADLSEIWAEAEFYYQQGLFDEAKKHYAKIIHLNPGNKQAIDRLTEIAREAEESQEFSKLAEAVDELEGLTGAATGEEMAASASDEEAVRALMQEIAQLKQKPEPAPSVEELIAEERPAVAPAKPKAVPEPKTEPKPRKQKPLSRPAAEEPAAETPPAAPPKPRVQPPAPVIEPARPELRAEEDFFDLGEEMRGVPPAVPPKTKAVAAERPEEDFFDLGEEQGAGGQASSFPAPRKPQAAAPSEDFFDLASELRDELSTVDVPPPSAPTADEQSLDDIFEEFKRGVEQQAVKEDADTHYNLGIAYKEMGLLDDAIGEFIMTTEEEPKFVQSRYMLGLCYLEQGDYQHAISEIQNALNYAENQGGEAGNRIGMHYDLGLAFQGTGDSDSALREFKKVHQADPAYRDVAAKIKELQEGEFVSLEQLKDDIEREISSKFLEEGERIEREEKTRKNEKVRG